VKVSIREGKVRHVGGGHDDLQGSRYPEALEKRTGL